MADCCGLHASDPCPCSFWLPKSCRRSLSSFFCGIDLHQRAAIAAVRGPSPELPAPDKTAWPLTAEAVWKTLTLHFKKKRVPKSDDAFTQNSIERCIQNSALIRVPKDACQGVATRVPQEDIASATGVGSLVFSAFTLPSPDPDTLPPAQTGMEFCAQTPQVMQNQAPSPQRPSPLYLKAECGVLHKVLPPWLAALPVFSSPPSFDSRKSQPIRSGPSSAARILPPMEGIWENA